MSDASRLYVGDEVDLTFTLSTAAGPLDVSAASSKTVRFRRPIGTTFEMTADFGTDGTDGAIVVTTDGDTFDAAGLWEAQAVVVLDSATKYAVRTQFRVYPAIVV